MVAGNKAQFKGEGTINGEGSYKFMISADDDNPDTFRIKIWDEENGVEVVVYDNGSQQALGGGSIVVHSGKGKAADVTEVSEAQATDAQQPRVFLPVIGKP